MISIKACKNGLMAFNSNDMFVGKSLQDYGEFSELEVNLFRALIKPGMTVLDVGANIGAFSVVFGKLVGPSGNVLAFEPQRMCYYLLCANIVLNELNTHVICLQNAVGKEEGRIHVPELNPNILNNFGGLDLMEDRKDTHGHSVKMVRIDDFKLPTCHFIKADIEGMEIDALLGAKDTIKRCRPILYVEADKKDKTTSLIRLIRSMGYKTLLHTPFLFNPDNFGGNPTNVFKNMSSINLFAYSSELPCPLSDRSVELIEVGKDRQHFVLNQSPVEAVRSVNETEYAIIQAYCSMADTYSDSIYDCDKAMRYLNEAIKIAPDDWKLYNRALPILSRYLRYEEALEYAETALEKGGNIDVVYNKAIILGALGRHDESIECYDRMLEFHPENPSVHFNRGIDLLKAGRYKEGWEEYEWRFKMGNQALMEVIGFLPDRPRWKGELLHGKRILLFIEQGAGDQIQFVRYAKMVKHLGGHVIVSCYPSMTEILKNVEGVDEVVVHGEEISLPEGFDCDMMCSLLSLPRIFGTDETNIPAEKSYIKVRKTKKFSDLDNDPAYLVGLCWAGSESHPLDFCRSCELRHFNCLAPLKGVKFVNLQMSTSKRVWGQCGPIDLLEGSSVPMIDVRDRITDYKDTADLINRLDLVITVDTSVAHLAGAMGKPTWILLGKNSDWRWPQEGTESDWYPSVRLFRGDSWEEILDDVKDALDRKLKPDVMRLSRTRKS